MSVHVGDKIRLIKMTDPNPIPSGSTGSVISVDIVYGDRIIGVKWDPPHENRLLNIVEPEDKFEIIDKLK